MKPCDMDDADLLLDGIPYEFVSLTDAEGYLKQLRGLAGAVWLPRCRRWGAHMPVTYRPDVDPRTDAPAGAKPPPVSWEHGRRVETLRLPEEEETP